MYRFPRTCQLEHMQWLEYSLGLRLLLLEGRLRRLPLSLLKHPTQTCTRFQELNQLIWSDYSRNLEVYLERRHRCFLTELIGPLKLTDYRFR